jgi:hypothetical protein
MTMGTPADKAKSGQVQGEGDYVAGRRFDKAEAGFVKSGKADEAARKAQPEDPALASEMEKAEQAGKAHSKGEAPGDLKGKKGAAKP